jgi:FlaA1/EpsC-like NDP-sugar epimerase
VFTALLLRHVSLYALVWGVIGFMAAVEGIPRSVILINWLLSLVVIGGLRVVLRQLLGGGIQRYVQVLMTAGYLHCLLHKSTPAFGHY